MLCIRVVNGQIAAYPYSIAQLKVDFPSTSFPSEIEAALLAEYGVYPVTLVQRPERTLTQNPVEATPQLVNGQWTQTWTMVDVSAEEAAQRQQDALDATHLSTIKTDAFVQSFIAMTPAQVETYVANNTANLAAVRSLLTKMALMLLALARAQYR